MFGAAALLTILGSLAILSLFDSDDDDNTGAQADPLPDDDPDPETHGDEIVLVGAGTEHIGDDDRQAYLFDPEETGGVSARIDAGGGDDIIDLTRLGGGIGLVGSEIDGGAGNEAISAAGELSTISGGDGDDTILGDLLSSEVNGDAGDDSIRVIAGASDPTVVDGGTGDDTIDGTGSENIALRGGAGDDVLLSEGGAVTGTGYVIASNGGDGDDTLSHEVNVFPLPMQDPSISPARLTGGDGADTFDIQLTSDNGVYSESDEDPAVFVNDAALITDFEPGIDTLSFDLSGFLAGYSVMTGELSEDTDAGTTSVVLRLTSDSGLPDQEVRVTVSALGLSWNDIAFTGTHPGTLTPAAA